MSRVVVFLILFSVFLTHDLEAKIRFLSSQFNRPEFLEMQWRLLEKFVLDDYELIVFNDALDPQFEEAIRKVCEDNHIQCVRFEQEWHNTDPLNEYIYRILKDPSNRYDFLFDLVDGELTLGGVAQQSSIRHNHVIQYGLDHFGYDHDDIVVILDHDLFPIKPVSIRKLLEKSPIVGVEMKVSDELHYLWVPFVAFDPTRLPNVRALKFNCDIINHYFYDTGAHTHHYLNANPEVVSEMHRRCYDKEFYHQPVQKLKEFGFQKEEIQLIKSMPWPGCIEFYVDYNFLHYGVGSADYHPIKQAGVLSYLKKILKR